MIASSAITTLFLDIGGVLLANGWDRSIRRRAAESFGLDFDEMNDRHHLTFDTYEQGKLSLDGYLNRVVFYRERPFSREEFKTFMFAQSKPYEEMLDLVRALKKRYGLKTVAVSNEGRELTIHRVEKFRLSDFIDFFVCSCFVHLRKPDEDIYRLALDMSRASPEQVLYMEDRAMFVETAQGLGIRAILHADYEATRAALTAVGLSLDG